MTRRRLGRPKRNGEPKLGLTLAGLGGGGGWVSNVRGITQSVARGAGGSFPAMPAGSWTVPADITALFYGDITALTGGTPRAWLFDAIGSTLAFRGFNLRIEPSTSMTFTVRRSSGAGASLSHTVSDATVSGPRLYWGVSANSGGLPTTTDKRVGVGNMVTGTQGVDWQGDSIQHGAGVSDHPITMGARCPLVSDVNVDSAAFAGARGLVIGRLLTSDEWAASAAGDFSWSDGDPDVIFDSAVNVPAGTEIDASDKFVDTSIRLVHGSTHPIAAAIG